MPELHGRLRRELCRPAEHLAARDTSFAAVARAPLDKIEAYRCAGAGRSRCTPPGSDFNYDFNVSSTSRLHRSNTTTEPGQSSRRPA